MGRPFCIRTPPMPIPLASHSISKVFVKSGNARSGASVSLFLSSSKAFCCAFPQTNVMWTSLLLIQPLYLQQHTYKDPSQDLVPNNLTIRYFRFLELFLTYMRI